MLFIAHDTILIACHIKTVALKMTGFPIIIACRVRAVGFKMTSLTAVTIKLKSFFKRTIGMHMIGGQTEMAFWSVISQKV